MPWFFKIIGGLIILFYAVVESKPVVTACFDASHCVHSYNQKCGINTKGVFKRFWDSCSMKKYNCENHGDFIVTHIENCEHIPPFSKKLIQPWERTLPEGLSTKIVLTTVTRKKAPKMYDKAFWCSVAASCNKTCDDMICGHDRRLKSFRVFSCECNMAGINCYYNLNYTGTNHSIEKCRKLIDESTHLGGINLATTTAKTKFIPYSIVKPKVIRFAFDVDVAYMGQNITKEPQSESEQETTSITETAGLTYEVPLSDIENQPSETKEEHPQLPEEDPSPEFESITKYQVQNTKDQRKPASKSTPPIETVMNSESEESLSQSNMEYELKPTHKPQQQAETPFESNSPTAPENKQIESYESVVEPESESLSELEQPSNLESNEQSIILFEATYSQTYKPKIKTEPPPKSNPQTENLKSEESLQEQGLEDEPAKQPESQTKTPPELIIPTETENIQPESDESISNSEQQSDVEYNQQPKLLLEEDIQGHENRTKPPLESNIPTEPENIKSDSEEFLQHQEQKSDKEPQDQKAELVKQSTNENDRQSDMETIRQSDIEIDRQSVPRLEPVLPELRNEREKQFHEYYG